MRRVRESAATVPAAQAPSGALYDATVSDPNPTLLRLEVGPVDLARRLVRREDQDRSLTTKETELLAYVAARAGQDIPREELLQEVWGYGPGVVSRTADTTMQRLRAKIERDPSNPRHLLTVHGLGYRFEGLGGGAPLRPVGSDDVDSSPTPTNLRPAEGRFVGRTAERARLASALTGETRLVTLLGAGGTGKTRLSREVGLDLADQGAFPGGVWFCDLTECQELPHVLATVGRTLGVELGEARGLRDPIERIGADLSQRGPTLLILDNAEQVVEEGAPLLVRWSAAQPHVRFLITSRERLRVAGEQPVPLDPLPDDDAVELFLDRAAEARGALTSDPRVRDEVRAIVERLDGLPLAIELVAPRASVLAPSDILAGLDSRFRLAASSRRDLPARQRTLRAALDWSWDLLDEAERSVWTQVSVFRGGFTTAAAEEVVELPPDAPWIPDVLQSLLDKSLIRSHEPEELPGDTRLTLLESVREYGAERLASSGDEAAARARHRASTLALGERLVSSYMRDDVRAWHRLRLEVDNLRAVLESADPAESARAALLMEEVLAVEGPTAHHRRLLDQAVERSGGAPDPLRLRLLLARIRAARRAGEHDAALSDSDEALRLGEQLGGAHHAEARFARGMVLDFAGRTDEAEPLYAEARELFAAVGSERGSLRTTVMQAFAWWQLGRQEEAEPALRRALEQVTAGALSVYSARNLSLLGIVLGARGRWEEALELLRGRSFGAMLFGSRRGESLLLANLGAFASARGDLDEGVQRTEQALRLHDDDPLLRAVMLRNLGLMEADRGDHGLAREHLLEALELHQQLRDDLGCARVWVDLGEVALLTGSLDDAREAMVKARAAAEDSGDRRQLGIVKACSAVFEHVTGDRQQASGVFEAALDELDAVAGPRVRGTMTALGAAMAADRDDRDAAHALLKRAERWLQPLGDRQGRGVLALARAVVQLADSRAADGHEAAVLRERAARVVASLAEEHDAHEVAVPRLLYERARAR